MLEKTLESLLDGRESKPISPEGNQAWIFIRKTDAEAEAPIPWPPDVKSWLVGKDPDAGKDGGQEEKGVPEDEIVGWHHRLDGHEFEQAPWDIEGQGSLAMLQFMGSQRAGHDLDTEQQNALEKTDCHIGQNAKSCYMVSARDM